MEFTNNKELFIHKKHGASDTLSHLKNEHLQLNINKRGIKIMKKCQNII